MCASSNSAAQLMQLGDAKTVGVLNDHHRCVGYVHTHLDHGCRDQYIDLAGGEPAHHRVLRIAWQLPVQHLDTQAGKRPAAQLLEQTLDCNCRRGITVAIKVLRIRAGRARGGNAGTDHVRLTALAHLFHNPLPDPLYPRGLTNGVDDDGAHLGSPGWNLAQRGGLKITKDGHSYRPRNGSRCHYQDMWARVRLDAQRRPLLNPKSVLLVNDHQAEVGELNVGAEQGMSADDDSGSTRCRLECRLATPRSR